MGQFLAVGLATNIYVKRKEVDSAGVSIEQLQEKMKQDFHYMPEIYVASDDEKFYHFTLRDDILDTQLIDFLNEIYPLLYNETDYYAHIIKKLKTLPSSKWLEWAEEKPGEAFQFDDYGQCDYIDINHSQICVNYDCLLLSMEGKISMEAYGRQFNFLKYTMVQTFRRFNIAGALRCYITG